MVKTYCSCVCHSEARANFEEAVQHDDYTRALIASNSPIVNIIVPVDADDPVEAAVASGCHCLAYHVTALSCRCDRVAGDSGICPVHCPRPWSRLSDGEDG